jgi:ankyrin repeat protein
VSDVTTMGLLLDKGADPNLRLRNQGTALMVAASRAGRNAGPEESTIAAMKLLIDRGADPNLVNDNGETALHIAVSRGDALVKFLAENGTRLDVKDKFGRTALDVAMGVPGGAGGGRGRGRGAAPAGPGPVRESTAALLKELMKVP